MILGRDGHPPEQPDDQDDARWRTLLRAPGCAPLAAGLWSRAVA